MIKEKRGALQRRPKKELIEMTTITQVKSSEGGPKTNFSFLDEAEIHGSTYPNLTFYRRVRLEKRKSYTLRIPRLLLDGFGEISIFKLQAGKTEDGQPLLVLQFCPQSKIFSEWAGKEKGESD